MSISRQLLLLAFIGLGAAAYACGPWLPPLLLVYNKQEAARAPVPDLVKELRQLPDLPSLPSGVKPRKFDSDEYQERRHMEVVWNKGEAQDFQDALAYYKIPAPAREALTAQYQVLRTAIESYRDPEFQKRVADPDARELLLGKLPAGLPGELEDYLRGAIAFHTGHYDEARAGWERLLARPVAERKFRSTWAAYMLGRMACWADPKDDANLTAAIHWMHRVRECVQEGCADGLNLVALSYYWEAIYLPHADLEETARLYSLSVAAGSSWATEDLQEIAYSIIHDPDDSIRVKAARSPLLRQLATVRILLELAQNERGVAAMNMQPETKDPIQRWLEIVNAAGVSEIKEADRLAWMEYALGRFQEAAAWVKKAPPNSWIAQWLRGKLALRGGRVDEAANEFSRALRQFPALVNGVESDTATTVDDGPRSPTPDQMSQLLFDRGATDLARGEFSAALDALLKSGTEMDAAYVAERLMTADELKAFVVKHHRAPIAWPAPTPNNPEERFGNLRANAPQVVHYLLARRLAREGRFAEAHNFMPPTLLARFDEYVKDRRVGDDRRNSREIRSAALWRAARIHRHLGMELFGTEAAPDFSCYEGEYEQDDAGAARTGKIKLTDYTGSDLIHTPWIPAVGGAEVRRLQEIRVNPDHRFHYRYVAADLARRAVRLRPPDDEAARMLCIAGNWLAYRDPDAGYSFYEEVLERCPGTALGLAAKERHSLPNVEEEPFQ